MIAIVTQIQKMPVLCPLLEHSSGMSSQEKLWQEMLPTLDFHIHPFSRVTVKMRWDFREVCVWGRTYE